MMPKSDIFLSSNITQGSQLPKPPLTCEDAHEGDAQSNVIVALRAGALAIPAHAFINITILAYEEAGEPQGRWRSA